MSRPQSLSLRIKFLLILTLLPLIVLGAYLAIAIDVFQSDKLAYVFEETSSISKTLALQTTTNWTSVLASVRPVLQDWAEKGSFGSLSQLLLTAESPVRWIAACELAEDGQLIKKGFVARSGLVPVAASPPTLASESEAESIVKSPFVTEKAVANRRTAIVPFGDERVVLLEKLDMPAPAKPLVFLILMDGKDLADSFRAPGSASNYLIDEKGLIMMGPPEFERTYLTAQIPVSFLSATPVAAPPPTPGGQRRQSGTEEVNNEHNEALLISYAPVQYGNLFVVSTVPKKAALEAVQILLRKSLIFFALLICATLVISLIASKNLTSALTQLFQATQKVAQGKFDIRVNVDSSDEVGSLAQSFNKMAAEVSRLMMETAEKARMESELRTAQTVQETLFPPVSARIGDLSVFGYYEPASEIGGDWWHYNWVDGKVFLWIGDATGHGAPAALITSAAKSASTVIENLKVDPATALDLLNRSIFDVSQGKIMMTFFLGCYDPVTHRLIYSNASHESPYLIRRSDQPPRKKDLIPLNDVNNPRLGQNRQSRYKQTTINLQPGDRILFYTDGIPDIKNPANEPWGERNFIKAVLEANKDFPPIDEAVTRLTGSFEKHRQKAMLHDDITFFMIEVHGGAQG
ncbi:MAG: sigma factor sigB regulation protein rsbU [Bdellovibrio sp.]|nr:MAG: sigma factor sigB regulation protein rsbU [Bdellovibrio sp.]